MKKVIFKSVAKVKQGRKMVSKIFEIIEHTDASDDMIKLRAMALNWQLISIEVSK